MSTGKEQLAVRVAENASSTEQGVGEGAPPQPTEGVSEAPEAAEAIYTEHTTPSGIEIRYYPEPHTYAIRPSKDSYERTEGDPAWDDWIEVPSISTVVKVLDKPGLKYWGQSIGVRGVAQLIPKYDLHKFVMEHGIDEAEEKILELMKQHALTIDLLKKEGGRKGDVAHKALELWAETGIEPDPMMAVPKDRGYIIGLLRFLRDAQPEVIGSEVKVASMEHGFAGRYDLRMNIPNDVKIVKHFTPGGNVRAKDIAKLTKGEYLLDLKTSGDVYDDHCKQIEGYEIGSIESGYQPTQGRGILLVDQRGLYKFKRSWAVAEDFLVTLAEYKSKQAMNARKKEIG